MRIVLLLLIGWLVFTSVSSAQDAPSLPDGQRLLVWAQPVDGGGGELLLLGSGEPQTVLPLSSSASDVSPCGVRATSPDGRFVAFSVTDGRTTNLYQMTDASPRLSILSNNINTMTCVVGVQYDPDSARVGYLMWASPAANAIVPAARLLIHNTETLALVGNFENVSDFTMTSEGASFVTMFRNAQNEYVEVGVNVWDGISTREVTTLVSNQSSGCVYTSASLDHITATQLAVTVGFRCRRGMTTTQYQIYSVDLETRIATLLLQGQTKTQFIPNARTNRVIVAPNEQTVFQLLPDNLRTDSGVLVEMQLAAPAERVLLPGAIQMPQANRTPTNGLPTTSPDGRWLGLVVNDANNNATLYAYDLNAAAIPPIFVPSSSRGDRFTGLQFTADSNTLVYLAGTPQVNAVFAINLTTGVNNRLARGRFNLDALALSPFTPTVALVDSRTLSDAQPRYDALVMVDLNTGAVTDLLVGANLSDNRVRDRLALVPIAWRKPAS
jgi:hypothetical protein